MKVKVVSALYGQVELQTTANGNATCTAQKRGGGTGTFYAGTQSYSDAVKWIFDEVQKMREDSPDLTFEPM